MIPTDPRELFTVRAEAWGRVEIGSLGDSSESLSLGIDHDECVYNIGRSRMSMILQNGYDEMGMTRVDYKVTEPIILVI